MESKVTISGCFSVKAEKETRVVNTANTAFTVAIMPEKLVMKGKGVLPEKISQVGNQIKLTLEKNIYDREHSLWLEKTDVPYMQGMKAGQWKNMMQEDSCVFVNLYGSAEEAESGGADEVIIIDPPTVNVGRDRRLEFAIYLQGENTERNFLMLAEQRIFAANKDNFRGEFTVYYCGFVHVPPEDGKNAENPVKKLEELLGSRKYESDTIPTMEQIRESAAKLPPENFEAVPVIYCDSQIYEFNGWGEET